MVNKKYNYTEEHKIKGLGEKYDKGMYSKDTWSNRIWQIEKEVLKKILRGKEKKKILDFATGTGRILYFLEKKGFVDLAGIDSSKSMLKPARKKLKKTKLFCVNLADDKQNKRLKKQKYDIIIAFRFFLNANIDLRQKILLELDKLLKKEGLLIFNIHANKRNFISLFAKKTYSLREIKKWILSTDLKIKEVYSYGFIPHRKNLKILPFKLWFSIEKKLVSRKNLFGSHLLIVCKKGGKNA
jgi:ubiquinone/menaquinone biosynthesis C-methylase UbiE